MDGIFGKDNTLSLLTQAFHDNGCASLDMGPLHHVQGWSLAARALDYIDQHAHDRLTIQQISQAMGCTSRAIEIAFNKALGIAPLQYVLARRLHNVRRDLLLRTNGTPIVTQPLPITASGTSGDFCTIIGACSANSHQAL